VAKWLSKESDVINPTLNPMFNLELDALSVPLKHCGLVEKKRGRGGEGRGGEGRGGKTVF